MVSGFHQEKYQTQTTHCNTTWNNTFKPSSPTLEFFNTISQDLTVRVFSKIKTSLNVHITFFKLVNLFKDIDTITEYQDLLLFYSVLKIA